MQNRQIFISHLRQVGKVKDVKREWNFMEPAYIF